MYLEKLMKKAKERIRQHEGKEITLAKDHDEELDDRICKGKQKQNGS